MLNIPDMETRWYTLSAKYIVRLQDQPTDSLVYKLHIHLERYSRLYNIKKKNKLIADTPQDSLGDLSNKYIKHLSKNYQKNLLTTSTDITIKSLHHNLSIDPIFIIPMTRKERRRLLRWRINWLPGRKVDCHCGDQITVNHILICPAIPETYWEHIQRTRLEGDIHPFNKILLKLPTTKPKTADEKQKLLQFWSPLWNHLLNILLIVDEICIRPQQPFEPEHNIGDLFYHWLTDD